MDHSTRHNSPGDLAQMLVMSEIDYLTRACHLTKQPEVSYALPGIEGNAIELAPVSTGQLA